MPSLREIEKTLATLWLNKDARKWLLSDRKKPLPDCLKDAPEEILRSVDRKGIKLYAGLMSFGHHDVMDSIYPFCSELLGGQWNAVVDDYLLRFPPEHHNFNRLCDRLSQYFTIYGGKWTERYPYISELADYEWIELEKMEEDTTIEQFPHKQLTEPADFSKFAPVVNPTLTVRDYKYNIIEIASYCQSDRKVPKVKPERTLVAIYRHSESHLCKFVEVGEAAAQVIERARKKTAYQDLIALAVALTPNLPPHEAVAEFLELMEDLQELGIFVGSTEV